MSNLHKRLIAHKGMTNEEKQNCQCEFCKNLNYRKNKKIIMRK